MDAAARQNHPLDPPLVIFEDGLGQRTRHTDASGGAGTDVLRLRPSFAAVSSFEFALRERVARLAAFRHAYYTRVRGVERSLGPEPSLAVVSDAAAGLRLSDVLTEAQARRLPIDINAALCLVRQLVPALAMLHESVRDVAHGAIAPERLLVTPQARLLITEHVLGAALEQLRYPRERYWSELRIAIPPGSFAPRFDHRTDVTQLGVVALSLILGRPLRDDEFPARIGDVVASTWAVSPRGGFEPLPPGLRGWLARTLQLDSQRSFASAVEARVELDTVLGDGELVSSPASLEAFLTRFTATEAMAPALTGAPRRPAPQPHTAQEVVAAAAAPAPPPAAPAATWPASPPAPIETALPTPPPAPVVEASGDVQPTVPAALEGYGGDDGGEADPGGFTPDQHVAWWRNWRSLGALVAVVAVIAAGGTITARRVSSDAGAYAPSGTLELSTRPAGVEAFVDGEPRGTTPLAIALSPGAHIVEIRDDTAPRRIPITINPGMKVSQFIELTAAPSAAVGAVTARDAGARPEPVPQPAAAAGTTAAAPASLGQPRPGVVTIVSAVIAQVFEGATLLGSVRDRLTLPAGRHVLEIVNDELGLRSSVVAEVVAGSSVAVTLQAPTGTLALNATPWAEVWVDGEKAGDTPIGTLALPVGTHDVVFRHPDLGERHLTAVVTTKGPTRLSVDFHAK